MHDFFASKPYLVAIVAAVAAQTLKVVSFIVLEKHVNFRRFVETDGAPNMHAAAFAALSLYVGFLQGFDSMVFTLSACLTAMVSVDMWNVKNAASRQAEIVELILQRLGTEPERVERSRKALSYTPVDVLSGTALGVLVALLLF